MALRLDADVDAVHGCAIGYGANRRPLELSSRAATRGLDLDGLAQALGDFLRTACTLSAALEETARH